MNELCSVVCIRSAGEAFRDELFLVSKLTNLYTKPQTSTMALEQRGGFTIHIYLSMWICNV